MTRRTTTQRQRPLVTALLLLQFCSFLSSASANTRNTKTHHHHHQRAEVPDWMQVSPNMAFQPSRGVSGHPPNHPRMNGAMKEALRRMLSSSSSSSSPTDLAYANGMQLTGEEWSSYQLAWRLLGYYIDCSSSDKCQRLVLYAVYVDPDYEGGGFGEYEYYDPSSGKFVCYNANGCRQKMDCHLTSTNWEMLGVFKINDISENNGWMEQLFKHEGVCVWGDDTYQFANNMRQHLPYVCKETNVVDPSTGNKLYYDVKPGRNATLTLALYVDNQCSSEYLGGTFDVFEITGASESDFDQFNKDLDTWKICQPCISYSVSAADNNYYCYDKAGYENCNQCMKFSNKAGCEIASARDITLAERQQTLVPFAMYGTVIGTATTATSVSRLSRVDTATTESFPFLKSSFIYFGVCGALLLVSLTWRKAVSSKTQNSKTISLLNETPVSPEKRRWKKKKRLFPLRPKEDPEAALASDVISGSPMSVSPETSPPEAELPPDETGKAPLVELEWLSLSRSGPPIPESIDAPPFTPSGARDVSFLESEEKNVALPDSAPIEEKQNSFRDSDPIIGEDSAHIPHESEPETYRPILDSDVENNAEPDSMEPSETEKDDLASILTSISREPSLTGAKEEVVNDKSEPFLDANDRLAQSRTPDRNSGIRKPPGSPSAWIKGAMQLWKNRRNRNSNNAPSEV